MQWRILCARAATMPLRSPNWPGLPFSLGRRPRTLLLIERQTAMLGGDDDGKGGRE
jgi:hypothetical protein